MSPIRMFLWAVFALCLVAEFVLFVRILDETNRQSTHFRTMCALRHGVFNRTDRQCYRSLDTIHIAPAVKL